MKQHCSMFKMLLAASFILLSSFSEARITKIKQSLLFVPHHLGDVALLHSEEKGFLVVHNGQEHLVDDFLLDPQLQGLSSDALDAFLCDGLISIIPHDSGEFELEACHSEAGKGPMLALFAGATVRGVAWGLIWLGAWKAMGFPNAAAATTKGGAAAEEVLGILTTAGASENAAGVAIVIEKASSLVPIITEPGAVMAKGAIVASGISVALPVIEAMALTIECILLPLPTL